MGNQHGSKLEQICIYMYDKPLIFTYIFMDKYG